MAPLGMRYFQCINNGVGVAIYPQLRKWGDTGTVLWDGRDLSGYEIAIV